MGYYKCKKEVQKEISRKLSLHHPLHNPSSNLWFLQLFKFKGPLMENLGSINSTKIEKIKIYRIVITHCDHEEPWLLLLCALELLIANTRNMSRMWRLIKMDYHKHDRNCRNYNEERNWVGLTLYSKGDRKVSWPRLSNGWPFMNASPTS